MRKGLLHRDGPAIARHAGLAAIAMSLLVACSTDSPQNPEVEETAEHLVSCEELQAALEDGVIDPTLLTRELLCECSDLAYEHASLLIESITLNIIGSLEEHHPLVRVGNSAELLAGMECAEIDAGEMLYTSFVELAPDIPIFAWPAFLELLEAGVRFEGEYLVEGLKSDHDVARSTAANLILASEQWGRPRALEIIASEDCSICRERMLHSMEWKITSDSMFAIGMANLVRERTEQGEPVPPEVEAMLAEFLPEE